MKVAAEVFKGIEFIRISNLPEDQKEFMRVSISGDNMIKILRDNVILHDCLQYHDYLSLYNQFKAQIVAGTSQQVQLTRSKNPLIYKFAFK